MQNGDAGNELYRVRLAEAADEPILMALMQASTQQLQAEFLSAEQIAASFEFMGIDRQLIVDETYFVARNESGIGGCGGWSRRATLFGGDHSTGRDARRLDPKKEPAKVRAMYTHPDHARRGIGRLILQACERSAATEGFLRVELAATLSGAQLYRTCGYEVIEPFEAVSQQGVRVPLLRMGKLLAAVG